MGRRATLSWCFVISGCISAALIGVLALGERLAGLQLLAFAMELAGAMLATLPSRAALRVSARARAGG